MKISIQDSAQMSRDFYEVFPRDLVEDLSEEEPQVAQTSENLDTLLSRTRQGLKELEKAEKWKFPLPQPHCPIMPESFQQKYSGQVVKPREPANVRKTLVASGWNVILRKGQKNWADLENLITLYALGQLFKGKSMPEKAKQDKAELIRVVEEFDRIKRPQAKKHLTAEQRMDSTKSYAFFAQKTIDASCISDEQLRIEALRDLEEECHEAMAGNEFNGWKLKKAYRIARQVMKTLHQRY